VEDFPQLGSNGWLIRDRALRAYVLFQEAPSEKARARTIIGLPRYLREHLAWQGPILRFGCDDVAAQVRERFSSKKSLELTDEEKAYFSGEDFDEGTTAAVADAMRDYGDTEPWLRFHGSVHRWLDRVNAKRPIALYLRPTLPNPGDPGPRHRRGLEALYENAERIAGLHAEPRDLAEELMEEAVLFAVTSLDDAHRFAPCLAQSFGADHHGQASLELLCALEDDHRAVFLRGLPPLERLGLLLRSDVLPRLLDLGGHGARLAAAFEAIRGSGPDADGLDAIARIVTEAMVTCARHDDPEAIEVILAELESHPSFYAPASGRLTDRGYLLRNDGHQAAFERYEAAVAAMQ